MNAPSTFPSTLSQEVRPADNWSICSIGNCEKPIRARALCNAHYQRLMKRGDPLAGETRKGETLQFAMAALSTETGDCIKWPYSRSCGYGWMTADGTQQLAHRFVCLKAHGAPPSPAHQAAHGCGNRSCVNPRHLRWATRSENEADKLIHGTRFRGERHPAAKLRDADIPTIIALRGRVTQKAIGARFGVTDSTISQIQTGKTHAYLNPRKGASK